MLQKVNDFDQTMAKNGLSPMSEIASSIGHDRGFDSIRSHSKYVARIFIPFQGHISFIFTAYNTYMRTLFFLYFLWILIVNEYFCVSTARLFLCD